MNRRLVLVSLFIAFASSATVFAARVLTIYQDGQFSFQQEIPLAAPAEISGLPDTLDPYSVLLAPKSSNFRIVSWEFLPGRTDPSADPFTALTNHQISIVDSLDHVFKGRVLKAYPDSVLLSQENTGSGFLLSRKDIKAVQLNPVSTSCLTDRPIVSASKIVLNLDPPSGGSVRFFYQASGLSCSPIYRAFIDDKSGKLEFLNEFYLENGTPADFTNVKLEYLEGEMQKVAPPTRARGMKMEMEAMAAPAPADVSESDVMDYVRYEVKTADGLRAFSKLHVTHFRITGAAFRKSYYYNPSLDAGQSAALTKISFTNAKSLGLGFNLPRGVVKIYSTEDGTVRFIGENMMERATEGDEIRLLPGGSRDVKVERQPQDQKKVSDRIYEQTVQFTVKNDKPEAVSLEIEEPLYGVWEIKNSSDKYRKNGIRSVSFFIDVAPKSERTVTYTVWQKQ